MTVSDAPSSAAIDIAILACPEVGASTLYGMYDLLAGAGRDWETFIEGKPTEGRLRPRILSRDGAPMTVGNGVRVTPDGSFEDLPAPASRLRAGVEHDSRRRTSPTTLPPRSPGCAAGTTPARRSPPRAPALCCWRKPACSMAIPPPRIGRTANSCSNAIRASMCRDIAHWWLQAKDNAC